MWLLSLMACEERAPAAPDSCLALAEKVDGSRILNTVKQLAATPRRSAARRAEVRASLAAALEAAGFAPTEAPFTISGVEGVNLVALAGRPVLVAAHYDSMPDTPGADDNASGVAVALELARVLGPKVDIAFFDAEEVHSARVGTDGRNYAFGSQAFVDAGARPALVIVLESVGYACADCQKLPPGLPPGMVKVDGEALYLVADSGGPWTQFEEHFNAGTTQHQAHRFEVPGGGKRLPQTRFSDHAPFWDVGVHAVMVTDTAILRNPAYHEAGDLPGALSPTLLADAARGAVVAACAAAP